MKACFTLGNENIFTRELIQIVGVPFYDTLSTVGVLASWKSLK